MSKRQYILKNLNCAHCASVLEEKINDLSGVSAADINFASKTLNLTTKSKEDIVNIEESIKRIIGRIEPSVRLSQKNDEISEPEGIDKIKILIMAVGAVFFLIALFFDLSKNFEIAMYTISYLLIGGDIFLSAVKNLIRGKVFNENFLMVIASTGALIIGEFGEGVAVMLFYKVGELFQDVAVNRSRKSIKALTDIRPEYANLKTDGDIVKTSPEDIKINDIIIIKPGERVPLDGTVVNGESFLDTSALTGESTPRKIREGDEILSGSVNLSGVLEVKVIKLYGESTVSRILDLVENAASRKSPTESFISKFARYYTPAVVFSAVLLALVPPLFFNGIWSIWVRRALIFLVVSCPCALVISIPLGFFGGIGGASRKGILIKGGNFLEALNFVHTAVFDKTGTLTEGIFSVSEIKSNSISPNLLLETAAYAEFYSNHPIAESIKKAYGKKIDKSRISDYSEISGKGISVKVDNSKILAGNAKLMSENGIEIKEEPSYGTVIRISADGVYSGYIVISDKIKDDSFKAMKALKSLNINLYMLTGDKKAVGEAIGKELGLDGVYSELLPEDKVSIVESLKAEVPKGKKLVFVGDGINDAPVLTRADVGIAMGGLGSDAAIEAADAVIMNDEPSKLFSAIKTAKKTKKIIKENIIFALSVKLLVLLLGAIGIATMWEAVFADVGVALIAVFNAMRALK